MKKVILVTVVVVIVAPVIWTTVDHDSQTSPEYRTARILEGDIETLVNATGMVRAITLVPVGSQVSGRIKEILVDYNSPVRKGQQVAAIEPDIFQGRVEVARANLEGAKAAVGTALAELESRRAQVENIRAKLEQARAFLDKCDVAVEDTRRNLERQKQLFAQKMISQSQLDSAVSAYDSARAQKREATASMSSYKAQLEGARLEVKVSQARHQAALAKVLHAEATLKTSEIDLGHTIIYSPVDGIVISRNVDVGQTVAASLQAPTLFTIAEDLSLMQVIASVDEADIGGVREGQKATFTVDAYPGDEFNGKVVQVRIMPRESQNVVTYDVVIEVANDDFKLKPGMTANVSIIKASRRGVLKVPAAALRFKPPAPEEGNGNVRKVPSADNSGGSRLQRIHKILTEKLRLDEGQQQQLSRILAAARQKFLALPKGPERESKGRRIRAESRRKIRNILTEEQKPVYDRLTAAWDARRKAARESGLKSQVWIISKQDGLLKIPVVLGISDDNHYELIKGNLKRGQEVVIGMAPREKRKKTTPPGFGFRRFR